MGSRAAVSMILTTLLVACGDDGSGLDAEDLRGAWTATAYLYTDNSDVQSQVDLIDRDGASFTLVVDASGEASTVFDDGVGGTSSDSGSLNSSATTLTLDGTEFAASRSGDVLTLVANDVTFDFGAGSTSATLEIRMVRA